jgi:hypothetical protein
MQFLFFMFDLNQVYLHRKSFPPQNNNEILIIPQNDHSVTWFVHEFYNITQQIFSKTSKLSVFFLYAKM